MIALIKLGAVICPCPTMLTPEDSRYRLNAGKFKMVITCLGHAGKVDEIAEECPPLSCRFLVDGERPGWISYPLGHLVTAGLWHDLTPKRRPLHVL